jgi:hypothetical protein
MRIIALCVGLLLASTAAHADPFTSSSPRSVADSCRCHGCGCKGGPGWRRQDGQCVSQSDKRLRLTAEHALHVRGRGAGMSARKLKNAEH